MCYFMQITLISGHFLFIEIAVTPTVEGYLRLVANPLQSLFLDH